MRKTTRRRVMAVALALAMVITGNTGPGWSLKRASAAEAQEPSEKDVTIYEDEAKTKIGHETLEEISLEQIAKQVPGITHATVASKNVTVYIKVTKVGRYSRLKIRGGNIEADSFSNKELIGRFNTTYSSKNSPHYLHLGYRTEQGYGSGVGEQGSGIYKFADCGLSKGQTDAGTGVRLTRMTNDVDAYIVGLVFAAGRSVTVSKPDSEGNVTFTDGYKVPSDLESWDLDSTDVTDEEYKQECIESLQSDIKAAQAIDRSDCPDEQTYQDIQDAIADAQAAIDDESSTYEDIQQAQKDLAATLVPIQNVIKAKKAVSDALTSLESVIGTAEAVQEKDCADQESYEDLQTSLAAAKEVAQGDYKSGDVDELNQFAAKINAAKEDLNTAMAAATSSLRVGLKASIAYCESLKAEDYTEKSFEPLADAIAAAKASYADKTLGNKGYKAARDKLELVRTRLAGKVSTDASNPKTFRTLTKDQVVKEMGAGINLGNTMDGGLYEVTETSWQAYKTTKEYIKALHDAGYNTVRIPVTWGQWIKSDYSIDEKWIGRVQEIVDYCVDQDMYAIINIHHDGAANHDDRGNNTPACWLDTYQSNIETVYQKYEGVWKTIAERFKDYDEHLIFESMNEVTDAHGTATNEDTDVLNCLNQLFVNTVRATGSNNTKRWLGITGRFATFSAGTTMPQDTLADQGTVGTTRLMFGVHIYKDNGSVRWSLSQLKTWQSSLSSTINNVKNLDPNMPVYVGEYGVRQQKQSGSATGYNDVERALNSEFCNATARFYGAVPVVWDQGDGDYSTTKTNTGLFNYWNRPSLAPVYKSTIDGMIRGTFYDEVASGESLADMYNRIYCSYGHKTTSDNSVSTEPTVTKITKIQADDTVTMSAGDYKTLNIKTTPENSNDVVLWSTSNDSVATVYNGMIHAKNPGIAVVDVYSQSGSVTKSIHVIVSGKVVATHDEILVENTNLTVEQGKTASAGATLKSTGTAEGLSYISANPTVATVDADGTIKGIEEGTTYVIVTSATGQSKMIEVKVPQSDLYTKVNVGLYVYKDGAAYGGTPVTIKEDGQYTVTWDLSKNAPDKNFTLSDLTAVYVYDTNAAARVVKKAQIRYDKFVVDGQELKITKSSFKSALKASGQFDTNDPINGWDGSCVEGVTVNSGTHTCSFNAGNPTTMTLTFTIQNLTFKTPATVQKNPAQDLKVIGDSKIALGKVGDFTDLKLQMTPADADSNVTFMSSDPLVAAVDSKALTPDENGVVSAQVVGLSEGTATIVAVSDNGLKLVYGIAVGKDAAEIEIKDPIGYIGTLLNSENPAGPTETPVVEPTEAPTEAPSEAPTEVPTQEPVPTLAPTDAPAAPTLNPVPGSPVTPPVVTGPAVTTLKKGDVFTAGCFVYKVTAEAGKKTGTVSLTGLSVSGKKAKYLSVPQSIAGADGNTYRVTTIGKNAFRSAKIKGIYLNKYITKIPSGAFAKCKKLKAITFQAKLKKVTKGAFKGCTKKIKVSGKSRKANIKLLKKSGYKKFK